MNLMFIIFRVFASVESDTVQDWSLAPVSVASWATLDSTFLTLFAQGGFGAVGDESNAMYRTWIVNEAVMKDEEQ